MSREPMLNARKRNGATMKNRRRIGSIAAEAKISAGTAHDISAKASSFRARRHAAPIEAASARRVASIDH